MTVKSIAKLAPLQQQMAPLRNKIIVALRGAIETGLLQPGERLVERDLCDQLAVSRTSLREALRELQADGILLQTGARGLSVAIVTHEEAENAYRIRAVLEALVVEQFIEHASDAEIDRLAAQAKVLRAAYLAGDVAQILICKRQFYDYICTGAANALAFEIINRVVLRTSALRSRSLARPSRQGQSVLEIDEIVSAIQVRDVPRAKSAATEHVVNAMRSALNPAPEPSAAKAKASRAKTTPPAAVKARPGKSATLA